MSDRFLIVGLGNPGPEYEATRHNVGFMGADALVSAHGLTYDHKKKSKSKIAEGTIAGQHVLVAKPQTFMNLSGGAVQGLVAFYQIPPERVLVVFDDLDLPLGTLRIRPKGGSGGHRGMTDIIRRLSTQDFPRVRFGIGRPPGRMDPAAYVLRRFSPEETPIVQEALRRIVGTVETWVTHGIDAAMNRYNGSAEDVAARLLPPRPPAASTDLTTDS